MAILFQDGIHTYRTNSYNPSPKLLLYVYYPADWEDFVENQEKDRGFANKFKLKYICGQEAELFKLFTTVKFTLL